MQPDPRQLSPGKNLLLASAAVFFFAMPPRLLAEPAQKSEPPTWEPAKTWVFVVSIAKFEGDRLHDFVPKERIDGDFINLFIKRGVPRKQIAFMKDEQCKAAAIPPAFDTFLRMTRPGDFLFFYYGSHGGYNPKSQSYFFSTYDSPGLNFDWAVEAIERRFQGSHAFLTTDTCHSGGIVDVVKRHKGTRVSYACLSSMYNHNSGSNVWRFVRCLMQGFAGHPAVDLDSNGHIDLDELARFTWDELSYLRRNSPMFLTTHTFDPKLRVAKTVGKRQPGVGRRVVFAAQDTVFRGVVEATNRGMVQLRRNSDDKLVWLQAASTWTYEPETILPVGTPVLMQRTCCSSNEEGLWFPATVRGARDPLYLCLPNGYSAAYDEWVGPHKLRPSLSGTWNGWIDSGAAAKEKVSVSIKEDATGAVTLVLPGGVALKGERLGKVAMFFEGQHNRQTYRGVGRFDQPHLALAYMTRQENGKSVYSGGIFQRGDDAKVPPVPHVSLVGRWSGFYENTIGGFSTDALDAQEDGRGHITGSWSGVPVAGERIWKYMFYLDGKNSTTSYRLVASISNQTLELQYVAHKEDKRKYEGWATLRRTQ